jgi:hypothetical protein
MEHMDRGHSLCSVLGVKRGRYRSSTSELKNNLIISILAIRSFRRFLSGGLALRVLC